MNFKAQLPMNNYFSSVDASNEIVKTIATTVEPIAKIAKAIAIRVKTVSRIMNTSSEESQHIGN